MKLGKTVCIRSVLWSKKIFATQSNHSKIYIKKGLESLYASLDLFSMFVVKLVYTFCFFLRSLNISVVFFLTIPSNESLSTVKFHY